MLEMPPRIASLRRTAQGWPIPYFVERPVDGTLDFRVMHPQRMVWALKRRLCWICGQPMGRHIAFVGGPLAIAQRQFSDPASHRDCAEYALRVCPFLASPATERRDANMPAHAVLPGHHVRANPGVSGLLLTGHYLFRDLIIHAGEAREVHWYTEGRPATRSEGEVAIEIARRREEVQRHPHRDRILALLDKLSLPA